MQLVDKLLAGFSKLFGNKSDKDLKKIWPIVEKIKAFEPALATLSDDELKAKTTAFKQRIKDAVKDIESDRDEIRAELAKTGEDDDLTVEKRRDLIEELEALDKEWLSTVEDVLNEILPEAFATLKETCRRFVGKSWTVAGNEITWNMVPYDVQLIGAIALHQGKIAEMKTGEGKTLVAIFPAYLNALVGRGVHLITVNDYLAKRDSEWNAPIFSFHGIKVDCIDRYEPNSELRRSAYRADITYGTNNEFGFDYLRDNMVGSPDQLVQTHHHFAIVDEVDSVLIDEARTPLIISGPVPQDNQTEKFVLLKPRVAKLVEGQKKLVAKLLVEAEEHLAKNEEDKAGLALLRAQRGFPKNKKFQKMMQEPSLQKLVQRTEYFYLQENAKNMPFVDDELYYSVDYKMNSIEMSDKGRDFITESGEEKDFFVIPDMGELISDLEEQMRALEASSMSEIEQNSAFSEAYKEELKQRKSQELAKEKARRMGDINRLFAERSERIHSVNQLLKAYTMFERDDEYIVVDGKVQIVDEHTGRVLSGRRYSDGLHQAIEAKENVRVEASTQTYATITLQNYFRMYHKLAGMTGTAVTEESEFFEIYKLEVVEIPTNRPVSRKDHEDLIFRSKREKFNAVLQRIEEYHKKGQPVLVGTTSVEVSETLSRMLQRAKIQHNVLNAKQHARESDIVKMAGQKGAVTIATNMAGRGTDIKLGEGMMDLGGLAIIGTERHESRRIDLQLRGRSGRQGDPGESQFYVSLEDDLMKLFASDRVASVMDRMKFEEGEVIQHPWLTKALERAQKRVEQNNFSIRKRQLEYDDVLNNQRKVIYKRRRHALLGEKITSDIQDMLSELVEAIVEQHYRDTDYDGIYEKLMRLLAIDVPFNREEWTAMGEEGLVEHIVQHAIEQYKQKERSIAEPVYQVLKQISESNQEIKPDFVQMMFSDGIRRMRLVIDVAEALASNGKDVLRTLERSAILSIIDDKWMEHLRDLDSLKEGIGLRAFGQKDPLVEYKREAFLMFQSLLNDINTDVISLIWRAVPESDNGQARYKSASAAQATQQKVDMSRAKAQHASGEGAGMQFGGAAQPARPSLPDQKQEPVVVGERIGRNDPCPCGSGKKYKACHGKV